MHQLNGPAAPASRGWLVLVGFGLVVAPTRMLIFVADSFLPIFRDGAWEASKPLHDVDFVTFLE